MSTICDNCPTNGYSTDSSTESSTTSHTNGFVLLNGMPYLVGEYIDNRAFTQVNRDAIKSELTIDNTDCMRTIIDISIDDIGKKEDGSLNVISNSQKMKDLVNVIKSNAHLMHYVLPIIRRGIVMRINYRLENQKTGMIIRSMVEDLRLYDRGYYLDINSSDLGSTAVVTNFANSLVSTVAQFTHGTDPLLIRITTIQLLYEAVMPHPYVPRQTDSIITDPEMVQYFYGCDADVYKAHMNLQSHHVFSSDYSGDSTCYGHLIPPTWDMVSRFYHFDTEANDIVIHDQEVYDPHVSLVPIACGKVDVNRTFVVNPGSRFIFKISIWKNDLIVVNDANQIATALGMPVNGNGSNSGSSGSGSGSTGGCGCGGDGTTNNTYPPTTDPNCNCNPGQNAGTCVDQKQNEIITKLGNRVDELINIIASMHPENPDLHKLQFEANVQGDPLTALIKHVEHLDHHLRRIEDKIDETVDTEYITTLVNEVQSALNDNPPKYATAEVIDDGGMSIIEQDTIGNINIVYRNKDMIYVDKNDPDAPSKDKSGWWAKVRVHAPEEMTSYSDFVNCKMRVSNYDGTWRDVNFWDEQDSTKEYSTDHYIDVNFLITIEKLETAVNAHKPITYEIQLDLNSNASYESRITVEIMPHHVFLFDKGMNMLWPYIKG